MDKISTNIKERVLQIAENKGVAKEKFINGIGMTYGNFKGKSKNTPLNSNAIEDIITKYPDINIEWLITGKGEMLEKFDQQVNESLAKYILKTDSKQESQLIPIYNLEATAGIVNLFKENTNYIPIDYLKIPNLPKCDGAIFVTGDSMYPLLKSGDIVIYKQITDIKNSIFWGEMYIVSIQVDGDDYISVKYIQKSDKGEQYIKLVSKNENHQPKDVLMEKINALAIVKASVRINTMN